jgi:hypothetical protein
VKRAVALVALVLVGAGCGASSASTPREGVGVFMTRILREEINGQWSKQWAELHPGHQKLITRAQYVTCSRGMGTNIATGKETFHVLAVQDEPIQVRGVPQHTSELVTIRFKEPGIDPLTYRLHAVAVSGRWAWILGNQFLAALGRGKCLDGSPLRG